MELINSLAPMVAKFQSRSMHREKDGNLVEYFKNKADQTLPRDARCLPNISGFEKLQIPDTVLIDPEVKQTNWNSISEFQKPFQES